MGQQKPNHFCVSLMAIKIFFDEIDGLAPVRSSKQDQIHSSIVSTLLALMDGLDNRGNPKF
jgi:SpoVK/Ycf46/Vps4 family AAA+-type ATPase